MTFFHNLFTHPTAWYHAHQLLVAQMGVNALLALSIWVTLYAGLLTLANIGFMAIGGYTTVILAIHLHTPVAVNVVCGALLAGVVAAVIGLPVLRLRGVYLAIATIGFGEVVRFGFILNLGITGKGQGLNNPAANPNALLPVWVAVVVMTAGFWVLTRLRTGRIWTAIREDELAAASGAVATVRYKLAAFVIGGIVAGFAGGLDAHLNFFIDPTEYGFNRAVLVLIFAFVGGILIPVGPVIGSIALTAVPEIFRSARTYRDVLYGAALILITIFRPQGLIGEWRRRAVVRGVGSSEIPPVPPGALLEVIGARRAFGGVRAVDGVDLTVNAGEIVGLIGPNGAGKTTLANLITGHERLQSGTIRAGGVDVTARTINERARLGVARTFQNLRLYRTLSALDNVIAGLDGGRGHGRSPRVLATRAAGLLARVGVAMEQGGTRAGELPYGDQRRVEIARALALDPHLLVLDEPAAGMNPVEKRGLVALIRELVASSGLGVLIIEHDVRLVSDLCDRVAVMDFGRKIAEGSPAEVVANPAVIAAYLGTGPDTAAVRRAAPDADRPTALEVEDLHVSYGAVHAVRGVNLRVRSGEVVCVIGANGAGKTSMLRALSGLIPGRGSARFGGIDLLRSSSARIVRTGLVHVPEGREILAQLTVEENLLLGGRARGRSDLGGAYARFPILEERRSLRAGQLSGGEQQMLAIARALMGDPQLLLLDEPSLGLGPRVVDEVFGLIAALAGEGATILLVEQNAARALELADRGYVLEMGTVVIEGDAPSLVNDARVRASYLGV